MTFENCPHCESLLPSKELKRRDGCRKYLCPGCVILHDQNPILFDTKLELLKIEQTLREQGVIDKVITLQLPDGSGLQIHWGELMKYQQKFLTIMINGDYQ